VGTESNLDFSFVSYNYFNCSYLSISNSWVGEEMSIGDIAREVLQERSEITLKELFKFLLTNKSITPFWKTVRSQKTSGVIYVPKKYQGKRVLIIIEEIEP